MLSLVTILDVAAASPGAGASHPGIIQFDLDGLDAAGLRGPEDGLRSLEYEYCIPIGTEFRSEVAIIDPSARFPTGSRGRIRCRSDQVLVLGNTHQPRFREILETLAGLPYVERIAECVFE